MNRAQRRLFNKKNHTNYSLEDFQRMLFLERLRNGKLDLDVAKNSNLEYDLHFDLKELIPDDSVVKLNYNAIISRPANDLTEEFKLWIEDHKNEEFHITRDGSSDQLVSFKEDVRMTEVDGNVVEKPKWLFDLYTDLYIKQDDQWKTLVDIQDEIVGDQTLSEEQEKANKILGKNN